MIANVEEEGLHPCKRHPFSMHAIIRWWQSMCRGEPFSDLGTNLICLTLSCQYFEMGWGLEEKSKARKAAVLKLVWPWPPAWAAAAFTYFPSLQLKLSQAFRPVCLIGRWTEKNWNNCGSLENLFSFIHRKCIACFKTNFDMSTFK